LESRAWVNAPPLKVDRFKGDEVGNLLEGMVVSDDEEEREGRDDGEGESEEGVKRMAS
jgi:hypothetical protein